MDSLKREAHTKEEKFLNYYKSLGEKNFFEDSHFSDENLPTWGDISFLLENKPYAHKLGIDEFFERTGSNNSKKVPAYVWKVLKKQMYFNEDEQRPQDRLDIIKDENFIELIKKGKIRKFEDFNYTQGISLMEATKRCHIPTYSSLYEFLCKVENLEDNKIACKLLTLLYGKNIELHKGSMEEIKDNNNEPDKSYSWLELKNFIFDPYLGVVIHKKYKDKFGYKTEEKISKEDLVKEDTDEYSQKYFLDSYKMYNEAIKKGYYNRNDDEDIEMGSNVYVKPIRNKPSYNQYQENEDRVLGKGERSQIR